MTQYEKGYIDGQKNLVKSWKKWKFGLWFFKRQRKELEVFLKDMNLDTSDIKITNI